VTQPLDRPFAPNLPAFENLSLECYKSNLRHALNFAYTEQNIRYAGKGFLVRGLVAFPSGQGATLQPVNRSIPRCMRSGKVAQLQYR